MKLPQSRTHQPKPPHYGLISLPPHTHPQRPLTSAPTDHNRRIQTPEQQRRHQIQLQTMNTQKAHLRDRLCQRLQKAYANGDRPLLRALRQEWQAQFPETPCAF
ncbi:hypothetical protein [Spirulina major]|uniref:hypothetical protein n=1 Tax=Spirulina major TaxID=270636 RepID=UPI000933AE5D|nr:hypothetical protein [Spirulina major]